MKCRDCQWITFTYDGSHLKSITCFKKEKNNMIDPDDPACQENFQKKKRKIHPEYDKKQKKFLYNEDAKYYHRSEIQEVGGIKMLRPLRIKKIKKKKEK